MVALAGKHMDSHEQMRGIVKYPEAGLLLGLLLAFSTYQAEKNIWHSEVAARISLMKMLFFWDWCMMI